METSSNFVSLTLRRTSAGSATVNDADELVSPIEMARINAWAKHNEIDTFSHMSKDELLAAVAQDAFVSAMDQAALKAYLIAT